MEKVNDNIVRFEKEALNVIKIRKFESFGFDEEGFDRNGFDRNGFDKVGFNRAKGLIGLNKAQKAIEIDPWNIYYAVEN